MNKLKFRGLSISKEQFEEKYNLELTDIEWKLIISNTTKKWEEDIDQIRSLASKYIRDSLIEVGYKPVLEEDKLKFKKV